MPMWRILPCALASRAASYRPVPSPGLGQKEGLWNWQADVDGDGDYDLVNATLILRYAMGLIDHFPAEEISKGN